MLFYNAVYKAVPLYITLGIMVPAYVVLYLPCTVQYITSAFAQISDSLLQAGRVFIGSPACVFCRLTLPMIARCILAGWMMIFCILSARHMIGKG